MHVSFLYAWTSHDSCMVIVFHAYHIQEGRLHAWTCMKCAETCMLYFKYMSNNSATLSGKSGVLSAKISSSLSLAWMTYTASPMGTLVNSEDTSKLTTAHRLLRQYSSFLIVSAKCLEFKTWELVSPTRGEMTEAMYLKSLLENDPMHDTLGGFLVDFGLGTWRSESVVQLCRDLLVIV